MRGNATACDTRVWVCDAPALREASRSAPPAPHAARAGRGAPRGRVRVTEASRAEPLFHHHRDEKSEKAVRLYTNYA